MFSLRSLIGKSFCRNLAIHHDSGNQGITLLIVLTRDGELCLQKLDGLRKTSPENHYRVSAQQTAFTSRNGHNPPTHSIHFLIPSKTDMRSLLDIHNQMTRL